MYKLSELLAINIRKYRTRKGLSQAQLSENCDLSQNYIQYIETQKNFPSEKVMERIAKELDIEPYKLFEVREELKKDLRDMIDDFIDSAFEKL